MNLLKCCYLVRTGTCKYEDLLKNENYILQEATRMLEREGVGNSDGRERSPDPSVRYCRSTRVAY